MWTSAIMVLPVLPFFPPAGGADARHRRRGAGAGRAVQRHRLPAVLPLIEEVGSASALTVTFLNPIFGILWGVLFLGETFGWNTLVGAPIVLVGTALVTGFAPRFGRASPTPAAQGK